MEVVDKWLEQSPKQMAIAIKELLLAFREARDPIWSNIKDVKILEIAKAQWFLSNNIIMFFLHKSWDKIMMQHLKESRKSSTKWLATLSNKIWEITEDQQKHHNDIEYGDDKQNSRSKQINIEVNGEIDKLYDAAPPL